MLIGFTSALALLVLLLGLGYATTTIPAPNRIATAQSTTVYYADGSRMGTLGSVNRQDVALSKVPLFVRHAVLAAEDRNFYSEAGISPTGILRALWVDLTGGDVAQGGSTITQQYAKNAYLSQQRSFTRKIREIFIAVKLDQNESKDQIFQDYLNTIYFGRGAYGIQAASRAYFRRNVSSLTLAQGAVLAAVINAPGIYDPKINPRLARQRWQYVLNGMVTKHWLSSSQASALNFPKTYSPPPTGCGRISGYICQAVQAELAKLGLDTSAGGYRVYTTIDRKAQQAAINAERSVLPHQDGTPESALVSVQPGNGAIRALYGGPGYLKPGVAESSFDLAGLPTSGQPGKTYTRQPGSSFKPYTLIAALEDGIGLNSVFDGPPSVDVGGTTFHNSGSESCYGCTLTDALAKSINTIFVPLAARVGPDKVAEVAHEAGIPNSIKLSDSAALTLGVTEVSVLDQADAYATIAAQGVHADPYIVARVLGSNGHVLYKAKPHTKRVFPRDVMADTTYAMTKVLSSGTAAGRELTGRPAAGKTGTTDANKDAWFIGFTPQLSTAVWVGNYNHKPLTNIPGYSGGVFGGELPAQIWQQMMNAALVGDPVVNFPPPANVGTSRGTSSFSPKPSASASASTTPTATPSTSSSPSLAPSPTVSPSAVLPSPTATGGPVVPSPSSGG